MLELWKVKVNEILVADEVLLFTEDPLPQVGEELLADGLFVTNLEYFPGFHKLEPLSPAKRTAIPNGIIRQVFARAGHRCERCRKKLVGARLATGLWKMRD